MRETQGSRAVSTCMKSSDSSVHADFTPISSQNGRAFVFCGRA